MSWDRSLAWSPSEPWTDESAPVEGNQVVGLQSNLNRKAATVGLDEAGAANAWAGTTGLETVHALNVKAGNVLPNYKALAGVLNQLAGTVAREVDGAAAAL